MKAYIQHKEKDTETVSLWENIPRDEIDVETEKEARLFAFALSKYLNKFVRLTLHRIEGNGIYYGSWR